jgi:peptidoglycan hydrolase-like protein with peptidoglycan-binding domain
VQVSEHVIGITPEGLGGSLEGVKALQADLNKLGFGPIDVDGSYGRQTRSAVKAFQLKHGLKADGFAGRTETLPAIEAAVGGA